MKNYWRCHFGDGGFDQKQQWHRASSVTGVFQTMELRRPFFLSLAILFTFATRFLRSSYLLQWVGMLLSPPFAFTQAMRRFSYNYWVRKKCSNPLQVAKCAIQEIHSCCPGKNVYPHLTSSHSSFSLVCNERPCNPPPNKFG